MHQAVRPHVDERDVAEVEEDAGDEAPAGVREDRGEAGVEEEPPGGEGLLMFMKPEEPGKVGGDQGGARWKKLGDPRLPSQTEVEEHYLTHVPYRNWCPHCVRGRGKDLDHRKSLEEDRRVREFSFDYCFPGDEMGSRITVLVGKERVTGMTMASVVPVKAHPGNLQQ